MDEFDDAATLSPSSDSGVEVPANPPPAQASSAFQAASSEGSKPAVAEPQGALKSLGEGANDAARNSANSATQTRADADPPERHTMQKFGGDILSGNKTLTSGARVTRDFTGNNTKSSTTTFASVQPDPLTDADIVAFIRFIDPKPGNINTGHINFFDALVESKDFNVDHALKVYFPTPGVRRAPEHSRLTLEQLLNAFMDKMYTLRDQEKRSAYSPFTAGGQVLTYSHCIPGEPPSDGTDEAPPAGFTRRTEAQMNTPRAQSSNPNININNIANSPARFIAIAAESCLAKQTPVFWFNPGSECMQTFAPLEEWSTFFGANMPNNVNAAKSRAKSEDRSLDTSATLIAESLRAPAVYANRNRTAFVHAIGSVYCLHLYYACAGLEDRFVDSLAAAGVSEINSAYIGAYDHIASVCRSVGYLCRRPC